MAEALQIIIDYWRAGGWLMLPLIAIMFGICHQYFSLLWQLRAALREDPTLYEQMDQHLRQHEQAELAEQLRTSPGATARLLRHLLARLRAGLPFREAFQQCREAELSPYGHGFYVLGALVMAAPLLGLLGTVLGMVSTFDAMASQSGNLARLMAAGISQALITTQVGLIAALPGAFGLAHLYRLYQRLRHALDRCESYAYLSLEDARTQR